MKRLYAGGKFGDYTVVKLLGKGGMGEVWLLEGKSGNLVAAKILDSAADHEARKRFLREAQLALGVKHPNLVETYDVGEDPESGLCFILMEYVSGGTLADYIQKNGALSIRDAITVVQSIAAVLELGRQKGIVHRDIKPANIMFDEDGMPKLADLGIARAGASTETTTVTQTGVMIGTPAYMSPEQMLDAHNVDTRADIYSLGVVFFEMLTGQRPNKDDTIVQLMAKAVKGEPLPDVRTLRPEVSASLAQLLNMMVVPDKDGRISTPGQITNALAIIERGGELKYHETCNTGTYRRQARKTPDASRAYSINAVMHWIIPIAIIAGLASVFYALAPKDRDPSHLVIKSIQREIVRTNVIERSVIKTNVVEKSIIRTNVVEESVISTNIAEKITKECSALPKVSRFDFKAKLIGVAVVSPNDRHNKNVDFKSPETHLEVPFGKMAIFKVEYDFPTGYTARVWTRDKWPASQKSNSSYFGSNPSGLYKGKGVTTGFLTLLERGKSCHLKSLVIRTMSEPEINDDMSDWILSTSDVDIRFLEKAKAGDDEKTDKSRVSTPPGWLDDLDLAKELAKRDHKQILVAFEGSDWCIWCKRMEKDVYSQPEFLSTATNRFVPVYIDKPHDKTLLRDAVRDKNPNLHNEHNVRSVPTVVILDEEGKEIGRVGGYKKSVSELMDKVNAIPGVQRDKIQTAKGMIDPIEFNDPDATKKTQKAFDAFFPGWKVSAIEPTISDCAAGYQPCQRGRNSVITTAPMSMEVPCVLSRRLKLDKKCPLLILEVASFAWDCDFLLSVRVNGKTELSPRLICTPDKMPYERIHIPLTKWSGRDVLIEIIHDSNNRYYEYALWSKIEIANGTGRDVCGPVGIVSTEIFPRAELKNKKWMKRSPWSYTVREPLSNWADLNFDDSRWKRTTKALGCDRGGDMKVADIWRSDQIWIRRKFNWKSNAAVYKAVFDLYYDQDAKIYLNGELVRDFGGWNTSWMPYSALTIPFASALRQGENVLAVTLKGDGASYFDCGLTIETSK